MGHPFWMTDFCNIPHHLYNIKRIMGKSSCYSFVKCNLAFIISYNSKSSSRNIPCWSLNSLWLRTAWQYLAVLKNLVVCGFAKQKSFCSFSQNSAIVLWKCVIWLVNFPQELMTIDLLGKIKYRNVSNH